MALTKTPPPGSFEGMEGEAQATAAPAPAPAPAEPTPSAQAKTEAVKATAAASASSAIAVRPNNTALAQALKKNTALDDMENVISPEMLEGMGFGAFPRITVDQGGFSRNKNEFIGQSIEIEIQSWNFVTLVTAGEKDDKEADKMVRSSYDHKTLPSEGCTVDEYIQKLKREHGYDNAQAKKYVEIYASLLWTEKQGPQPADDIKLVQLSVSPQSVAQWGRYLLESRMKVGKGLPVSTSVVIGSERKTVGSNTFGVMQFGVQKPAGK